MLNIPCYSSRNLRASSKSPGRMVKGVPGLRAQGTPSSFSDFQVIDICFSQLIVRSSKTLAFYTN